MSHHEEVRLCGVALPRGGTAVLSIADAPRVELRIVSPFPPQFDPGTAGELGAALIGWAAGHGYRVPVDVLDRLEVPDVADVRDALAYIDRVTPAAPSATIGQAGAIDRLREYVEDADRAPSRPRVPLAPMPHVRDLETVVGYVEDVLRGQPSSALTTAKAVERLRQSIDAATAARDDFFAELNGRADADPVVVERGRDADTIEALIAAAHRVLRYVTARLDTPGMTAIGSLAHAVAAVDPAGDGHRDVVTVPRPTLARVLGYIETDRLATVHARADVVTLRGLADR